ncbi:MAG TPA: Ni/Fe hydrogenase subunit alpha [Candidatus Acidoferrales bacterium]|nr:Ni/Fe hydrogenase subunit alpha [Candidatus Acidoferrales bacterium]
MRKITIDPVTRIEGHAKITIQVGEDGNVERTHFHVTQVRGFEKFTEGRPYYEMPGITARICGICPISHLLASAKACDAIMAVRIPPAAALIREAIHCGQIVQSHALSFFHLSAPDLLLGMDSDPAVRNVLGLAEKHPEIARDGIALRKFGQRVIEQLAGERIHPSGIVPGGVSSPLPVATRDAILTDLREARGIAWRTLDLFKCILDGFPSEIETFGKMQTMYAGLVGPAGELRLYDGRIRFKAASGAIAAEFDAADYATFIGEASMADSYLKSPYYKPLGYPTGIYRVGPLARLNAADRCGTPDADAELRDFRERFGPVVESSFHYHYARLIEIIYALERLQILLETPAILDRHVRARAEVNALEGVGVAEAPRGILIHHYRVDERGAMQWANLIIATGHNNLAMNRSIEQVSRYYVKGNRLEEGMLNRVSAVVRAYDPCLSCSTHADGTVPLRIELVGPGGAVLDTLTSGRR